MISKTIKGGKRVVRLQAPDIRKLNDTSFTLKQIAAGIDDLDEQAHLQNMAKECGDIVTRYTDAPKAETPAEPETKAKK